MFFNQPKINRISAYLEKTLSEICRDRWTHYLSLVDSTENTFHPIFYNDHCNGPIDFNSLFLTRPLFREKENFSWEIPIHDDEALLFYSLENAKKQYAYYSRLFKMAQMINGELQRKDPNYQTVQDYAQTIKNLKINVPSVISGANIEIHVGASMGGNLFTDLFKGIGGIFYAPFMALVSLFCAIPYCLGYSKYCGSPEFFLDTALYFCESLFQIALSVLFPLGMLYSAYISDSYNPFTKGAVERCCEGIIALATEELGHTYEASHCQQVPV